MAAKTPAWAQGLDPDQRAFYEGLDPAQWVCRGRRRHRFNTDEPLANGSLPEGMRLEKVTGGWELRDYCIRGCGRFLVFDTTNRGEIDWGSKHYGGGGPRYHARGLGLTATDDRRFFEHQQGEQLADMIRLWIKRQRARRSQPAEGAA